MREVGGGREKSRETEGKERKCTLCESFDKVLKEERKRRNKGRKARKGK